MGAWPVVQVDPCGESMKNNGGAPSSSSLSLIDPVTRRVLAEIASLLQNDESMKIVINKAGGRDSRVKLEITRYVEVEIR